MDRHNHSHAVRKIVLPSGRSIEVVRFEEDPSTDVRHLHLCPGCASDLVQPHDWSEAAAEGSWQMTLECPNCGWHEQGVYSRAEVELLEERLDAGVEAMIDDLRRLTHANMTLELDRLAAALAVDLILPEDF